ncbi:hypothetical protein NEOC65_000938 [Neochlamydia sp. AcF65]|nr:hypothetical protein [Neochlamydia sp. AcF65]
MPLSMILINNYSHQIFYWRFYKFSVLSRKNNFIFAI